jgi:hypothetical protein
MDEQECVKSDVALSCFIRAALRGLLQKQEGDFELQPHYVLVNNLHAVIKDGLNASVQHPEGVTARQVCHHLHKIAEKNASLEEKKYLGIIKHRIEGGNLSDLILRDVKKRLLKTSLEEALLTVYGSLANNLERNKVYA